MKTHHSSHTTGTACIIFILCLAMMAITASQAQSNAAIKVTKLRPKQTDQASQQLIDNFLAVSGGKPAHIQLNNIRASGTIIQAGQSKSFQLIETQNGCRQLTYAWQHRGRSYKTLYAFDGVHVWQQELLPKKKYPEPLSGREALHFARQHWLIQPFVLPLRADFVFKYQGESKVSGRPSYMIVGFGKNNERSWFYFDKETFLLTRWGGKGTIGGIEEYMDYRASHFIPVNGVLLPKQIDLIAEDSPFGMIIFDTITANETLDAKMFYMPPSTIPTLRQKIF